MPSPTSSEITDEAAGADGPAGESATVVETAPPAVLARWRTARRVGLVAYGLLAVVQYRWGLPWSSPGLPLEREQVIGWLLVGSMVWSLGRDRRELALALAGWGALGVCFVLYDFTRGAIDGWWGSPVTIPGSHVQIPRQAVLNAERITTAERALFFGHLPTEWLQSRLYQRCARPCERNWGPRWEVVTALTYSSHFVVVFVVAMVQWARDKVAWLRWVRALVTLVVLGVVGYLLFPTAPPWLAERYGITGPVARPGTRAMGHVGLEIADRMWTKGSAAVNVVAAMPSLHFAFSALAAFFFWRTAGPGLRAVLVAYPGVMLFTLVYGGEHYVLDCLVGGALAWLAVWLNRWWDERRRVARGDPASEVAPAQGSAAQLSSE